MVLGLAFQRVRSVLLALLLGSAVLALTEAQAGYLHLVPVLCILVVLAREPRLWSVRMLIYLSLIALCWQLSAHLEAGMSTFVGQHFSDFAFGSGGILMLLAAGLCLLRWIFRGGCMDLGHAVLLLLAAPAFAASPLSAETRMGILALAVCSLVPALLWAAYQMAFIDPLTGLQNRRALDERLARGGWHLGVAMVDVDFFKKVNDRHGHDVGDIVLKAVARELGRTRGAIAYRFGGEEFCLVFSPNKLPQASAIVEHVRERIEAMRVRTGSGPPVGKVHAVRRGSRADELRVTVSIGLASRTPEARTVEAVVKAADTALYRAKQRGRNCVVAA